MVIKRVSPISAAKVAAVLYALMGLIIGGLFSLIAMFGGFAAGMSGDEGAAAAPFVGMFFGVGAIIILPIFYGVCGAIVVAIGAALYNVVAGMVGGIEIDVA
ncbi:MAG: hypothetical protein R2752_19510 [Vicinamibacterales bacterium]